MRLRATLTALIVLAASFVAVGRADADPDAGFAGTGRYTDDAVDAFSVGVRPNGNVVAVAKAGIDTLKVTELRPDGSLDTTFGTGGTQLVTVPGASATNQIAALDAVQLLPNGKIMVQAWSSGAGTFVGRINANGTPDASFSGDGFDYLVHCGRLVHGAADPATGAVYSVAYQAPTTPASPCTGTTVRRWSAAGVLDTGWGNQSVAGGHHEPGMFPSTAVVDSAGRLVVGGGTATAQMSVMRITPAGATDTTLDPSGVFAFDPVPAVGYEDFGQVFAFAFGFQNKMVLDIEVDSADNIVVVGASRSAPGSGVEAVTAKISNTGGLEPAYGTGGVSVANLGPNDYALRLAIDSVDRVLVTGSQGTGTIGADSPYTQFLARLTASGAVDTGFGDSGLIAGFAALPTEDSEPVSLALANDNRYYLGGLRQDTTVYGGYVTAADPDPSTAVAGFNPIVPVRVMDTRNGTGGGTILAPGETRDLTVVGLGGVPAVGVEAVAINVTAVRPTAAGWLTIWPKGQAQPNASAINFAPADVVANGLVMGVGTNGQISIQNPRGNTDVIVDVNGWFSTSSSFNPVTPYRAMDTRAGTGGIKLTPGETRNLTVTGAGGVPATGVTAIALNLTIVNPTASGWLTVWPSGQAQPNASAINFTPGDVRANGLMMGVGANGQISIQNPRGNTDVIVDINGWYGATAEYVSVNPVRVMDTRGGLGGIELAPGETRDVVVLGAGGVPASNVKAVALNLTVVNPTASGWLTLWPKGQAQPNASAINFAPGDVVANGLIIAVGSNGKVSIQNPRGNTDVIVDINGYFPG